MVAATAVVARAPSVPVALVGFVIALAAIQIGTETGSFGSRVAGGLVPACLSYVAMRFVSDLVPQVGTIAEAIAQGAEPVHQFCSRIRYPSQLHCSRGARDRAGRVVAPLERAAGGGRRADGCGGRCAGGLVALLPLMAPAAAAEPVAIFSNAAYHGLFWLGAAAMLCSLLPAGGPLTGTDAEQARGRRRPAWRDRRTARWLPAAGGLAAMAAGVCLVGTAYISSTAVRSIRVFNSGGLDWDRPAFGKFGPFSGGMFGLWPVYCRAEGFRFQRY